MAVPGYEQCTWTREVPLSYVAVCSPCAGIDRISRSKYSISP